MNAKALIPLVAGLGIAGFAAKLGLDYVKSAKGDQVQTIELWTPVQDVKRGVAIDETMLKPIAFPASALPQGALRDVKKIIGRVPHTGAPAGLPILDSMLLPPGVKPGVLVPAGLRAVAVKIDESSGVDNHLEPGCHVDVVGVFTVRRNNRAETVAKTLIENVEVAAVGQRLAPTTPVRESEEGSKGKRSKRERPPRAVTLLVKPDQVPVLHLAEQKGKLKLSMRGTLDDGSEHKSVTVHERTLLGDDPGKQADAQPSLGNKLSAFMGSLWQKHESEPKPEPPPAPKPEPVVVTPPPPPAPAWVMVVYNGDDRQALGWAEMDSFQPVELSDEGPNIFQDDPRRPPIPGLKSTPPVKTKTDVKQPVAKAPVKSRQTEAKPGCKSECGSKAEPNTDADNESEPEELFE